MNSNYNEETVLTVHHWTDTLFTFTTTRDSGFRFTNGQFIMIGLPVNGKPLLRAYSIVSPNYEEDMEFFSIKVQDGPLTSRLQHLKVGDKIICGRKATGTLVIDNLLPGKHLYLLGTGTGLAPFMSIIRDPAVYERFEKVILCHGVRTVAELAYADLIKNKLPNDEFLGEQISRQLIYYPTVTREAFHHQGRLNDLLDSGKLSQDVGLPPFSVADDRVMLCGSPALVSGLRELLAKHHFTEGNMGEPGHFVVERAFVEK
ncbi:MAG: ferredoxin--NADP reductase [Hyphomicrobiales bacterium]|nr:ferredoxin--NADP reductase [Hyphomicrobiales bacterium]